MQEITAIAELKRFVHAEQAAGRRIGFVPTMGALHEGHLTLVDEARRRTDTVLLSVFVNPLQFGPNEDLDRYPRKLDSDRALAAARGVDALFVPTVETIYPPGSDIRVVAGASAERWEGATRPGHFIGVLTVVAKLLHLVEPDVLCLGQKDIQQVTLIRRMLRDLDWPVELAVVTTAREPDGLALSSRNVYLSAEERRRALSISRGLRAAVDAYERGERSAAALERVVGSELDAAGLRPDYIAIAEPNAMWPVDRVERGTVVAIAARVGATRLIDNVILGA